jgi:hypothetical protein
MLNISEANAVNDLLQWLFCDPEFEREYAIGGDTDNVTAAGLVAAERLARSANKALSAGIDPAHVRANWPPKRLCLCAGPAKKKTRRG